MSVISKSAETNEVRTFYVSKLAGPRVARRRGTKGEALQLTEHQARAELASGALVAEEALVDDPWGEAAAAAKAAAAMGASGATGATGGATGATGATGSAAGATGPTGATGAKG